MPAFESERYRLDDLPASKAELLKQLDLGNQTKQKSIFVLTDLNMLISNEKYLGWLILKERKNLIVYEKF